MLPLEKWKGSHTVITACLSVLKSPPTVPMITADCALVTSLVETLKVARVDPAGTVTLGGTVAAAVLSLVRSTAKPPDGAAESLHGIPCGSTGSRESADGLSTGMYGGLRGTRGTYAT
jgi:hypothetical protein